MIYTLHIYTATSSQFYAGAWHRRIERLYTLKTSPTHERDPGSATLATRLNAGGRPSAVAAALPFGQALPTTRQYAARILREWRKLPRHRFGARRTKNSTSVPLLVA